MITRAGFWAVYPEKPVVKENNMPHELNVLIPVVFLILGLIGMSFLTQKFRQPLLVGYILVGLLINVLGLDKNLDEEQFKGLADFGLAFGADIPHLVAVADGKVALHRGHPDLVVKFFFAN